MNTLSIHFDQSDTPKASAKPLHPSDGRSCFLVTVQIGNTLVQFFADNRQAFDALKGEVEVAFRAFEVSEEEEAGG